MPITLTVSEGLLEPDCVYAADGAWGIAGRSYGNAELIDMIGAAAAR